jgi:hypothetical protein
MWNINRISAIIKKVAALALMQLKAFAAGPQDNHSKRFQPPHTTME